MFLKMRYVLVFKLVVFVEMSCGIVNVVMMVVVYVYFRVYEFVMLWSLGLGILVGNVIDSE